VIKIIFLCPFLASNLNSVQINIYLTADKNPEEIEKDEDEYFQKMYQQWKGIKDKDNDPTYKIIPKFYFKVLLIFCVLL